MLKRFIYEVVAETQEAAENRLKEAGHRKYYLLTTEPVKDFEKLLKEAQDTTRDKKEDDIIIAYYEGYKDALEDFGKELRDMIYLPQN